MNLVLRVLGIELVSRLGARLPGRWPRIVSVGVLLVANLAPVLGVWQGWLGFGDVFALYWLENVVVWLTSTIRILTVGDEGMLHNVGLAAFFLVHYGIFTLVHGIFTLVLTAMAGGLTGDTTALLVTLGLLATSHVVNLAFFWFANGARLGATSGRTMAAPYPRMIVLHVSVILAGFFLLEDDTVFGPEGLNEFWPVLALCGLKTIVDLAGALLAEKLRMADIEISVDGQPVS